MMDSGASSHLSFDKDNMSNSRALESRTTVTFADGQQAKAAGVGEVILNTKVNGFTGTVQNVLYVPEAKANLSSIKQAADSGANIVFQQDKCVVTKDGLTWVERFSKNGVYILRQEQQFAMAATSKQTPELWHRRLGHLGYDNIHKLKNKDMVEGLAISAADIKAQQNFLCEPFSFFSFLFSGLQGNCPPSATWQRYRTNLIWKMSTLRRQMPTKIPDKLKMCETPALSVHNCKCACLTLYVSLV